MSGNEFMLSAEQEAAIKHRGSPLLVSAAAGSGKTKVLVERLLDHIEDGDNIDEFLVITYTRAAAAELRERIYDEILRRIAEDPGNRRLRRQSMLCRSAPIGTIHSFCSDILRENAHLVRIIHNFRVLDEHESEIIKAAVLEDVLDKAYETIETVDGFRALIDATSAGRDDKRLVMMILDVHAKLQSSPDPQKWVEEQIRKLTMSGISDLSETVWGKHLIDNSRRLAGYWRNEIVRLRQEMRSHPEFDEAYGTSVEASIESCDAFLDALDKGWEEAHCHGVIGFPRPKPIKGYDELKSIRSKCKAEMEKCTAVFTCGSDEHIEDMQAVAPAISALLRLILDFDGAYSEEKRSRGVVDFSDLEHLTISLLTDSETGKKTDIARAISKRFKEIMVDEYQDINKVQELIFSAVSNEEKNIFMVGDVKQSIYRFRLADPSIFLSKYNSATASEYKKSESLWHGVVDDRGKIPSATDNVRITSKEDVVIPNSQPTLVLLSKNYRSRAGILDFINLIFERIMSVEFGEMDYAARERLIPGRMDDAEPEPVIELSIIDMSTLEVDEDEESPGKIQIEAQFIAKRITQLTDGSHTIPDDQGGSRCIEYSDIAILLRSVSGKAWQYAGTLSEYGIPSDMPDSEGFFETTEISAALSLLSVIDNPMQDIPLAAVLRGPAYGFTADELAGIRAQSRDTDYYSALIKAAKSNDKCSAFLKDIDEMRARVPDMSADRFIWHMYNKTGLPGRVGAMRGGNKRRNNLMLLAEYARRFEQNGYKGLFDFLTYIRGLQDRGAELAGEETVASQNVVSIMSIHKSKGLEFPIVFLADTSKQFNYTDLHKPLVLHTGLGVGINRIDKQRRIEYPTIARMAVQSKLKAELLAEEMRTLYVAMTRAREKLIITAALKQGSGVRGQELGDVGYEETGDVGIRNIKDDYKVSPIILENIKSMAGWLLAALQITNYKLQCTNTPPTAPSAWDIRVIPASDVSSKSVGDAALGVTPFDNTAPVGDDALGVPPCDNTAPVGDDEIPNSEFQIQNSLVDQLRERFSFVYPYAKALDLPSKLTVTGLKGRQIETDAADEAEKAVFVKKNEVSTRRFDPAKPDYTAETTGLTSAERGTAMHLVMQYMDYTKCVGAEGAGYELHRLTDQGFLSVQQADAVDIKKITRFFATDIGKRVLESENMEREFKFSLLCPAESYYPGGGDDQILLQGIIDCFFEEDGELVVIDFKTDQITPDTLDDKAKSYTPQLAAYAQALERITGKRVRERIIYFFELDKACIV